MPPKSRFDRMFCAATLVLLELNSEVKVPRSVLHQILIVAIDLNITQKQEVYSGL